MDMQDTIQELQREMAALGASPSKLPSTFSRVSSATESSVDPSIIFSRLDAERNQKALKRGLNSQKVGISSRIQALRINKWWSKRRPYLYVEPISSTVWKNTFLKKSWVNIFGTVVLIGHSNDFTIWNVFRHVVVPWLFTDAQGMLSWCLYKYTACYWNVSCHVLTSALS